MNRAVLTTEIDDIEISVWYYPNNKDFVCINPNLDKYCDKIDWEYIYYCLKNNL